MPCLPRAGALRRPLLLVLLWSFPAAAQSPGVRVERRSPRVVEVSPGAASTVVFRVVNSGGGSARVATRAELPPGWRLVAGGGAVELAPGAADARLVGFVAPVWAPAGSYAVRFRAVAGGVASGDSVVVRVRERRRLELRLLEAPVLAAGGDAYTSTFLLLNRGNVAARVRLRASGGDGFPARVDTLPLTLFPEEMRVVPVRVLTPRALERTVRHPLELRAADLADDAGAVSASSRVEVIPRPAPTPRFRRFPVSVTLRAASAPAGGIPAEASGSGPLLPGGRLHLDFLARGADSYLGQRPEYRATLSGRGVEVRVGDHLWTGSPLAGGMRPGRGAGGSLAAGPWTAAGFARRGGPGTAGESEEAASLALRLGGSARVEAGGFRRSGPGAGTGWTVRAVSAALPWARLEAEYGLGGRPGGHGDARLLHLSGSGRLLSYSLRHRSIGEGFPWQGGPTRQDFASLLLRPGGPLRLDASFDRREGGSVGVPVAPATIGEWSLRTGIAYGGALSVRYEERGGAGAARSAGVLRSGEVRLGLGSGPLRLHPLLQLGTVAGPEVGGEQPFRRLALRSTLAGRGGSLSAHLDRVDGAVPGRPGALWATEAALDGTLRLGTGGELHGVLRSARYGGVPWSEVTFDAGAGRSLPLGHRVSAGVRLARLGAAVRSLFRLDYTIPVGIPVAPGGTGGRVVGRVYDAETGAPLAGAAVTLGGRTVLTDEGGRLAFSGLPAGSYPLRVEGRGAGAGRVPMDAALVVLRPGDREVRTEVRVARSARLRGAVWLVAGADSSGVAGVVLELARAGEVLRRVSGADGGFDFTDLWPGRWTLSVASAGLPPHHRFEREAVEVELAPGEARELALRVLPVQRRVRMITGGEIAVEAPRPAGGRP